MTPDPTSPTVPVAGSDPQSFSSLQPQEAVVPVEADGQVSGQWTYHHGDLNPVPGQHVDMLQRHGGWAHGQSDAEPWRRYWAWGLLHKSGADIVAYRMATVIHDVTTKWAEYEDDLSDVIGDSIDMDWTSRDGAKAVVRWLETFKPDAVGMSEANKPSPSNPPPEGKVASQLVLPRGAWKDQRLSRLERVKAHRIEFGSDLKAAVEAVDEAAGVAVIIDKTASPTEQASDVSGLVDRKAQARIDAVLDHFFLEPDSKMLVAVSRFAKPPLFLRIGDLRALSQAQQVKP